MFQRFRPSSLPLLLLVIACGVHGPAQATPPAPKPTELEALVDSSLAHYRWLHEHPELSGQEEKTAAYLARALGQLGIPVETKVGGHGLVAQLKNGPGKVLLLRTELDALPVHEDTGLPYASREKGRPEGQLEETSIMHACGHDLHMAAWLGTAEYLVTHKSMWHGTVVLVGQPAEETLRGARAMFSAGLLERIPRPDLAFAIHDHDQLPVGQIGYSVGPYAASADSVSITVFGRGGHGAYPQLAVDPIVLASRIVLALQTIVSRESDPLEPVVISVGSIHGGTKNNVIPERVQLELTVRTYSETSRAKVLAAIQRIAASEALSANAPSPPKVEIEPGTGVAMNAPDTTRELVSLLGKRWGAQQLSELPKEMGSEDFGEFSRAGIPSVQLMIGAADRERYEQYQRDGSPLAPIHSSRFAPALPGTLRTGLLVEIETALHVLRR
jgi:amidohydrolase